MDVEAVERGESLETPDPRKGLLFVNKSNFLMFTFPRIRMNKTLFSAGVLLIIVIFIVENGQTLKCYQCRSDTDENCGSSVSQNWSAACPSSAVSCRKIRQMLKFKDSESWTSIRECAQSVESGDSCYNFKWRKIAKQEVCECKKDDCNSGNSHTENFLTYTIILWMFHHMNP